MASGLIPWPASLVEGVARLADAGRGLVPVVVQEDRSGEVLMLAWADREALKRCLTTGQGWYWSRERKCLWRKGESSGNTQQVVAVAVDCDRDAVLLTVRQRGPACHTGHKTCFFTELSEDMVDDLAFAGVAPDAFLGTLCGIIEDRARNPMPGSYVAGLLSDPSGLRALQKVGEEAVEFALAGGEMRHNGSPAVRSAAVGEAADLLFHYLVALRALGIPLAEVSDELRRRHEQARGKAPGSGETSTPGERTER